MSDTPVLQGDVIIGKYPIPSQVHSIMLPNSTRTCKTTPCLILPYLLPGNIKSVRSKVIK
jgi:hypothetical protein